MQTPFLQLARRSILLLSRGSRVPAIAIAFLLLGSSAFAGQPPTLGKIDLQPVYVHKNEEDRNELKVAEKEFRTGLEVAKQVYARIGIKVEGAEKFISFRYPNLPNAFEGADRRAKFEALKNAFLSEFPELPESTLVVFHVPNVGNTDAKGERNVGFTSVHILLDITDRAGEVKKVTPETLAHEIGHALSRVGMNFHVHYGPKGVGDQLEHRASSGPLMYQYKLDERLLENQSIHGTRYIDFTEMVGARQFDREVELMTETEVFLTQSPYVQPSPSASTWTVEMTYQAKYDERSGEYNSLKLVGATGPIGRPVPTYFERIDGDVKAEMESMHEYLVRSTHALGSEADRIAKNDASVLDRLEEWNDDVRSQKTDCSVGVWLSSKETTTAACADIRVPGGFPATRPINASETVPDLLVAAQSNAGMRPPGYDNYVLVTVAGIPSATKQLNAKISVAKGRSALRPVPSSRPHSFGLGGFALYVKESDLVGATLLRIEYNTGL